MKEENSETCVLMGTERRQRSPMLMSPTVRPVPKSTMPQGNISSQIMERKSGIGPFFFVVCLGLSPAFENCGGRYLISFTPLVPSIQRAVNETPNSHTLDVASEDWSDVMLVRNQCLLCLHATQWV